MAGTRIPDFPLELLGSGEQLKASDLEGKAVVLKCWASWCEPCVEEAPDLQKAYASYAGQDVVVPGDDVQDSVRDGRGLVEEFGIAYPTFCDPNLTLYREVGVRGLPESGTGRSERSHQEAGCDRPRAAGEPDPGDAGGGLMGVRFSATLEQSGKTASGIRVPAEVAQALGKAQKPPVKATINGRHAYRGSVAVMGGEYLLM